MSESEGDPPLPPSSANKGKLSRMVSDPGVTLPTGKDGILDRRLSDAKAPTAMNRMRLAQRNTVAAEDTLAQIAQDAESRLAAKRRERAERRTIKMAELKRRQTIEEEEDRKNNGATSPTDIGDASSLLSASSSASSGLDKLGRDRGESLSSAISRDRVRGESLDQASGVDVPSRTGSSIGRRGSDASAHSGDVDATPAVPAREHKELLAKYAALEEKFKSCMMTNETLDNEKSAVTYKLDLMTDKFEEQEEKLMEAERMRKEKVRETDRAKRKIKELERDVGLLRLQLQQRQDLIERHGLVLVGGDAVILENGDGSGGDAGIEDDDVTNRGRVDGKVGAAALITPQAAALLEKAAGPSGSLDARLRKFAAEKEDLRDVIRRLTVELETAKTTSMVNGEARLVNGDGGGDHHHHNHIDDEEGEESKLKEEKKKQQLEESKLKLAKAELEMTNLEGTVTRMEQQIKRYQEMLADSEKTEEELKTERRKLQRELRDALVQVEELTTANKHLKTRLDKVRAVKGNLQNELNKPI